MKEIILYYNVADDLLKKLEKHFIVHRHTFKNEMDTSFYEDLKRAEGIIGSKLKVNAALLDQAPNLKIVSNIAVGYDNLDIEELTKRGIMATNTPDVLTETVADTIIGLLIATARRIPELDRYVKDGKWDSFLGKDLFGLDVHHKTLGIIGMGRIGKAIAKRAFHGFGMNILYNSRSRKEDVEREMEATYVSLTELLEQSDFVCVMAPLTPETVHMIGKKELQLMKKSAILINGSRGALVNELDLVEALLNREITAAGLDVFEKEPTDKSNPLLQMDNVVTLPHIGSATFETRYNMAQLGVENIIKGLTGEIPPSLINIEVLVK